MRCPKCSNENSDTVKFCTSCGAPLGEVTTQIEPCSPTQTTGPLPSTRRKMKRSTNTKVVIVIVIALLVAGGAAAGVITWLMLEANKPEAKVLSVDLVRADGDTLDLEEVPLDTELALKVRYRSHFKDEGKGKMRITVVTNDGEEILDKSYEVKSSKDEQTNEINYTMTQGSGEPIKAKAALAVEQGEKKLSSSKTLTYTAVEGKGAEVLLEEARNTAIAKCEEATAAVGELSSLNIGASDLAERLSKALDDLEAATTAEEADAVTQAAQGIIDECNARKSAAAEEQARNQDIAAAKQVMYDYAYAEKGNAESIDLVDFSMNDQRTRANATYMGMVTVHTDPDHAGQKNYYYVTAEKRGGGWVVTDFSYEFIQ